MTDFNQNDFEGKLDRLGDLYEEGKDCLSQIFSPAKEHARLYEILREMRDMAAGQMQTIHWKSDN